MVLATTVDRSRLVAAPGQLTAGRRATVAGALNDLLGLKGAAATSLTLLVISKLLQRVVCSERSAARAISL